MSTTFWVHCDSHGRPHQVVDGSCWCGVTSDDIGREPPMLFTTLLEAKTRNEAFEECRARGLWLYVPSGPTP